MSQVWGYLLSVLGVGALILAGNRKWYGWALGILSELCWLAFAIVIHQYGLIFGAAAYGAVYVRNLVKWRALRG